VRRTAGSIFTFSSSCYECRLESWKVATDDFRDFKVDPESPCLSSRSCLAVVQVAPSWAVL
jgi:hypothetical protein